LLSGLWLLLRLLGLLRLPFGRLGVLCRCISHACSIHQLECAKATQMILMKTFQEMYGRKIYR
jgi:hypothetical protein